MKTLICLLLLLTFDMPRTPRNIQSPYTATDFWNQWNSVNPRMSLFALVTPQSFWSSVSPVGLTSNTRNMTLPGHVGVTFYSTPGITPTQLETALDTPSNLEMTGIYQSGIFEQEDVIAGKWNFSTVEIFSASWDHPEYGELVWAKCKMGELKDYQTYFNAEARGLMNLLSQDVNKVTSRQCRVHEFGDAECGVNLAGNVTISAVAYPIRTTGLVTDGSYAPEDTFIILTKASLPAFPENFFSNGKMTAVNGPNNGVSREIAYSSAESGDFITIQLKRPFPFELSDGDPSWTITLTGGCNRTVEDCIKYDNILRRRAEDYIPTAEDANRVPPSN